jgi:hypothetical protein
MVRLVFRPYTQIRRTICTSVSLRTSTRVSPGFILPKHSSPSFGSQQLRFHSHLCRNSGAVFLKRRSIRFFERISLSLCRRELLSYTCVDVRLLGPCFKTGLQVMHSVEQLCLKLRILSRKILIRKPIRRAVN